MLIVSSKADYALFGPPPGRQVVRPVALDVGRNHRRDLLAGREMKLSPGSVQREKPLPHRHFAHWPSTGIVQIVEVPNQPVPQSTEKLGGAEHIGRWKVDRPGIASVVAHLPTNLDHSIHQLGRVKQLPVRALNFTGSAERVCVVHTDGNQPGSIGAIPVT